MRKHIGTRITIVTPRQPTSTRYTFERLPIRLLKTDVTEYILFEPCRFVITGHVGVALDGRYLLYAKPDEAGYTAREALAAKLAMIVVDEVTQ